MDVKHSPPKALASTIFVGIYILNFGELYRLDEMFPSGSIVFFGFWAYLAG